MLVGGMNNEEEIPSKEGITISIKKINLCMFGYNNLCGVRKRLILERAMVVEFKEGLVNCWIISMLFINPLVFLLLV